MSELTSIDAKNGKETYEELLERCKNFIPDDVYCLIMKVYFPIHQAFYTADDIVIWDTFILGYTPDLDTAKDFVKYHEDECESYPLGCVRYIHDRGLIDNDIYEGLLKFDYVKVGFKYVRVRKVSVPTHRDEICKIVFS